MAPLENYEIVKKIAAQKGDSDVVNAEQSLKALLSARANLMLAKAQVQSEILEKLGEDDVKATEKELADYLNSAKQYGAAVEDAGDASADDIYSKQINDIKGGDM